MIHVHTVTKYIKIWNLLFPHFFTKAQYFDAQRLNFLNVKGARCESILEPVAHLFRQDQLLN